MKIKNKVKISIIMSVFNEERHLLRCILSVLKQNFSSFEFLILDDRSTDRSKYILRNFRNLDKRIKIFYFPKKLGLTKGLNLLISKAKSSLIARIDGDDFWSKEKLRLQYYQIKNTSFKIIGTNSFFLDRNICTKSNLPLSSISIYKQFFFSNPFVHSSVIFKKKRLDRIYCDSFTKCQDYDAWFKIVVKEKLNTKNLSRYLTYHSLEKKYNFMTLVNTIKIKRNILKHKKNFSLKYYFHIFVFAFKNSFKFLLNLK